MHPLWVRQPAAGTSGIVGPLHPHAFHNRARCLGRLAALNLPDAQSVRCFWEGRGDAMAHRIGILGLGIMGERMLRNMRDHPAFTIVAAWDPTNAALDKLGHLVPAARAADDATALV